MSVKGLEEWHFEEQLRSLGVIFNILMRGSKGQEMMSLLSWRDPREWPKAVSREGVDLISALFSHRLVGQSSHSSKHDRVWIGLGQHSIGTWCDYWGCPMQGQELITLMGPSHLHIFYNSMLIILELQGKVKHKQHQARLPHCRWEDINFLKT